MIPVSLKHVAGALGVGERSEYADIVVRRVTTDSRVVEPGDLFWAIRGERFDGNEFIAQAAAKGAVACVCSLDVDSRSSNLDRVPCLRVDDSTAALGHFAAYYRREIMLRSTAVVAVTGSNGKTTTKSMIDCVLAPSYKGRSAPKSFNNSIGVPLTLLSGEADDRYLIMEIGTNSRGEVAALAAIGSPDVAVITSIGEAHLEGLGDVQAVAVEKTSLLDYLRPQALAVVNTDRPEVRPLLRRGVSTRLLTFGCHPRAELRITEVDATIRGTRFLLSGKYRVELTLPGVHHSANAAAAFAVGRWFGLDPAEIADRLRSFRPAEGRTQLAEVDGVTLIDDSYNANPTSMAAAVATLRLASETRRVLVMGDMLELGPDSALLHERTVRTAYEAGIEVIVAAGPLMIEAVQRVDPPGAKVRVITCTDAEAAADTAASIVSSGDTVWIKGSRAMQLDLVAARLKDSRRPQVAVA